MLRRFEPKLYSNDAKYQFISVEKLVHPTNLHQHTSHFTLYALHFTLHTYGAHPLPNKPNPHTPSKGYVMLQSTICNFCLFLFSL